MKRRSALRADTTVVPAGESAERSLRPRASDLLSPDRSRRRRSAEVDGNRSLDLECSCGKRWWITSSLDDRILERFVTHGGPRVGGVGDGPSAA